MIFFSQMGNGLLLGDIWLASQDVTTIVCLLYPLVKWEGAVGMFMLLMYLLSQPIPPLLSGVLFWLTSPPSSPPTQMT